MARPSEEKLGGLEIISIGTLYNGPWDKKYWSSSRGKDRYPYPVGYQAVRTHNGITYKMEIHEGHKGPSFMITSSDGQSCSGQTPDIAWESFQKKGRPRIKLLHGKRFSSKIDGMEIFGFRNPFVQRLLRELVANIDGTAEQCLSLSSICQGTSGTESCAISDPVPVPHLTRPQVKGERSRKHKIKNNGSTNGDSLKRQRTQKKRNAEASNCRQRTQQNYNGKNPMTYFASNEEYGIHNNASETVGDGQNNPFASAKGLPFESSDHLDEEVLPQEKSKIVGSEKCIAMGVVDKLSVDDEPLDRSKDTESKGFDSSLVAVNKDGDARVQKHSENFSDVDLYAPDTLDPIHDSTSDYAPRSLNESPYKVENIVKSEEMVTESHPEELGISSGTSEKSDFDSVDEEIGKSMMTVLLPRALPLLKTFSRKKNEKRKPSGIPSASMRTEFEDNGTDHCADVASPGGVVVGTSLLHMQEKEEIWILNTDLGSILPNSGQVTAVVPDSFENDVCEHHTINQLHPSSDVAEAIRAPVGQDTCIPDTLGLTVRVEAPEESTVSHCVTGEGQKLCSYDDVHMASTERLQKGCDLLSDSTLGCTSPNINIFCEANKDMCSNSIENSLCLEIHCKEKGLKTSSDFAEGATDDNLKGVASSVQISHKEISADKAGDGTCTPFTQTPKVASSERKYNGPLTESIICRDFGDGCALNTNTHTTTSFLLNSEIQPVSSIDHGSYKSDLSTAEFRLEGCPRSLDTEKKPLNPDGILHNGAPDLLQGQALVSASKEEDNSNFLDPSMACIEKPHGTSFSDARMEFKDGSNLKPHMNVENNYKAESIVELVGCYVHPMPVSSVLVSTNGNEMYICVLCGFLLDINRTLFIYKVSVKKENVGSPSFIGYTPIMMPTTTDAFLRKIALDRSGLQFTPDGQCLVLLNSIKAPNCREGKMQCSCSECTSDCSEKTAIKIVQVKLGYVTVVVRLKSADNILCVLVCEPNHLIGVEESGKLRLWVMNSTWSAEIEGCDLPTSDCMSPGIFELKRIPHMAALVIGHNGFGEFSLWDISKRILISMFSFPSTPVFQFLPISLFRWQRQGPFSTDPDRKEHITEIMAAARMSFSKQVDNHASLPFQGEDVAIWLLISTVSNSDVEYDYQSREGKTNPVGSWRLALLVKNTVILGSALDPRSVASGASAGHGIIGTCDGLVYMWELSTGAKLGNLRCFKGTGVSCVATDDSGSGLLAVAGGDKLMVYLHSQVAFSNQQGN